MTAFLDEVKRIRAKDAELYVELVGPKDAPALYYLHGGPGYHSYSFRDLMGDELTRYKVLYADQRGAGRSPFEGAAELTTLADDVTTILGDLGIPNATLLAHGFGALIAAEVAARHAERVDKVILVNPWVDMPMLARSLQREAAIMSGQAELALPPEGALAENTTLEPEALLEQAFGWQPSRQLLDAMQFPNAASRLRLEHSDAEALIGSPMGEAPPNLWTLSVTAILKTLQQATIVLVGRQDKTCYPEQAEATLEAMPHALFSLLDTGHYPWLDDPDTFTAVLHDALRT